MTESLINISLSPAIKPRRLNIITMVYNTIVMSTKKSIYKHIEHLMLDRVRKGQSDKIVELSTIYRNYYFITDTSMIEAILKHARMGEGEYFGEGRQLLVIAEALGRHRISKDKQDSKQKRSILAQLLSQSEKHIPNMQKITKALLVNWGSVVQFPLNVNYDLKKYTLELYLRSVFNYQGEIDCLVPLIDKQVQLLSKKLSNKVICNFRGNFKKLKAKIVACLASDEGLMTTSNYIDRLQDYINKHYSEIKDDAFSTGLNGAVLAGYLAPYPAFVSLIYELGENSKYQELLYCEYQNEVASESIFENYIRKEDTLLHAVIHEVLRLHPSQPFIFRSTTKNLTIEGHHLNQKCELILDLYHAQRDSVIWGDNAMQFSPERFLNNPNLYRDSFLSYSSGANNCTGQLFSRYSLKVLLIELVKEYSWFVNNGKRRHIFSFALEFDNDVEIVLKKRK